MACCAGSPSPLAPYRLRDADACPSRRLALPLSERPSFLPALAILPILHPLPLWCHSESLIWAIMGQGKARYPRPLNSRTEYNLKVLPSFLGLNSRPYPPL